MARFATLDDFADVCVNRTRRWEDVVAEVVVKPRRDPALDQAASGTVQAS